MKKSAIIGAILNIFISMPINIYINYWTLKQLPADRLIWFLFIINIPVIILGLTLMKFAESD